MANYIKFDVYDLQFSNIRSDSQLRQLLLDTGNRSILVVEDIDCSIDLPERSATPDSMAPRPEVSTVARETLHSWRKEDTACFPIWIPAVPTISVHIIFCKLRRWKKGASLVNAYNSIDFT